MWKVQMKLTAASVAKTKAIIATRRTRMAFMVDTLDRRRIRDID